MAASILSQDLIGICLLFAEGNLQASLEGTIAAAEKYEEKYDRHFGTSKGDFKALFLSLFSFDLGKTENLKNIEIQKVIPLILEYHAVHFNDEGATLFGEGIETSLDDYDRLGIEHWNGYSREEFSHKIEIKEAMKDYVRRKYRSPKAVRAWMTAQGIDEGLLHHCSRLGASS